MELTGQVQSLIDSGDWLGLLNYERNLIGGISGAHDLLLWSLGIGICLLVIFVWMQIAFPVASPYSLPDKPIANVETRKHNPRGPTFIPLELGDVTVDLQPRINETIHTAIGGVSRLGKSTAVLQLLELKCGVLVIALDNTRPIMERIRELDDGLEWTNEPNWPIGIDLLRGSPRVVSEVLVEGWAARSAGDTGKWRRISRDRLWTALEEMDKLGVERSMPELARALWVKSGDAEVDRACRDWASRLLLLTRTLGSSLGHDLDIAEAMRARKKVLLRVNPYLNPLDAPMLSGMLLVHARRAAQEAGVPFVIIVEEAGQMDDYQEEMVPLAQAAADRGVPLVILTQNLSKLPIKVANNISLWVSFAQEAKAEMAWAAHMLRLEPEHLRREAFPGKGEQQGRGWCYVRAPGVSTRLVHIKLRKAPPRRPVSLPAARPATRWEVVPDPPAVNGWHPWTPALASGYEEESVPSWVGTDKDMLRMWNQCKRLDEEVILWSPTRGIWFDKRGCLEWQGSFTNPTTRSSPRPRSTIARRDITVYIEFFRRARGNPEPTLDHLCDHPFCCDPDHLEAVSISDNNARREPRRLAFELAGYSKHDGHWTKAVLSA